MKKALITGVAGFAGGFLAEHLLSQKDFNVIGTYLSEDQLKFTSHIKDMVELKKLDLLNSEATLHLIKSAKPDCVFHLAALTSPKESFENPSLTITNNIAAQVNLLEAIRGAGIDSKILIISSADVYGLVNAKDLPIDEETALMPVSPYAVSKLTQDFLGLQYFLSYGLQIVRVRPFNHIGPRQSASFVVSSFAKQIAEIEKRKKEKTIHVGNLSAKRDFTDVRDMMAAYLLALQKGKLGDVYNIGSGVSYKISEILYTLLSLSTEKIKVEVDKNLLRPKDEPELRCDRSKFTAQTGWEPKIKIEQTLKDTLDYYRNIV
ncbi:MAG: GDP-mannose 4,6-dehydratase [Candidatus Levybacteria bacterium]|nr:GDP-mannose 4,6-dehydratase [Candidatus Levybacteria bacterium]